jgi:hypothetical protein
MGLQVGKKSAGRSFLLRFSLYPAVEKKGEIIFYRDLHISHTRGSGLKNHFFISRAHNHWKLSFPTAIVLVLGNILKETSI